MAIYSQAIRTAGVTINNAAMAVRAAASVRPKILEIGIFGSVATAQTFGLIRPSAVGTASTSALFQQEDPADPTATTNMDSAWSVQPTVGAIYLRRWNGAATIGVGVIWTFPRGLVVAASGSIALWNVTATVASDVYAVIDE